MNPKLRLIFSLMLFVTLTAQAQTVPLDKRKVSGILRDSLNKPISGATVSLFSLRDTMHTATNDFGYYGFDDVLSAEFLLTVKALGYDAYNRRYFNNDTRAQLNIPPIRLGIKVEELDEVTIEGLRGPSIRGDTTEFWARDYIVRDYARLEDLLRRMEGITIDPDGSVYYNGEEVVRALFNNETYFTGSVREAMKELPADIVERVQIIDRNVEGTGSRTLKSEETSKVMNIVTKEDKSAGKMFSFVLEGGTQSRGKIDGSMRRIDGRDQMTVTAGYKQVPEGVKSDPVPGTIGQGGLGGAVMRTSGGGSGVTSGQHKELTASLGKNIVLPGFYMYPQYNFNYDDRWSGTETLSENFYEEGSIRSTSDHYTQGRQQNHRLAGMYQIRRTDGKTNILTGNLTAGYLHYDRLSRRNNDRTGLINSLEREVTDRTGSTFNYQLTADYRRPLGSKWNYSLMGVSSFNGDQGDEDTRTDVFAMRDPSLQPDSSIHQLRNTQDTRFSNYLHNALTWTLSDAFKVQYGLRISHALNLRDIRARLLEGGSFIHQPQLSNYQSTDAFSIPLSVNPEYTFRNGFYLSPSVELNNSWLSGRLNPGTPAIGRFDALLRPRMQVGYVNQKLGSVTLGYRLSYQQPSIAQLNPDPFYQTPYDVQIGNPDLDNSKTGDIDFRYSHFFRKIRLNVSLLSNFTHENRSIVADRQTQIDPEAGIMKTTTRYLNVAGGSRQMHHINLSQTISKMNSTLTYTGMVSTNNSPYFLNGKQEERESRMQQHRLSFFYSPVSWLEITPELAYRANEDKSSLRTFAGTIYNRMFSTDLKLGVFLPKDFRVNANLSQSLHETTNIMTNTSPFVVNANIEKRIFKAKNGIISFVVMDLARQNAFTNYTSNEMGYTNTLTNLDSRYFLLQFSWQPQFWGRSRHDTGQGRRGDGSFIN